jgi:uncharacterized membrane-anchored protein
MRSAIAFLALLACLALVDYSIAAKERQLETGRLVYLELAPVDPRSLMQGDYMALRFKMANDARSQMPREPAARPQEFPLRGGLASADGRLVASLDDQSIATFRRLDNGTPLAPNEVVLRYRVRNGDLKFATNAFFFEEGTARRYEGARYGAFRVAPDGDLLLTGLRGANLQPL